MRDISIGLERQKNQLIDSRPFKKPEEVVKWLGAVQAQDYLGALWTIGLRTSDARESKIEAALSNKLIVRTWPMRGTLHFVAAEDVRWMLSLLTPRIIARSAGNYKKMELTETTLSKSEQVLIKGLEGGKQLDRKAIYQLLEKAGTPTSNLRGNHIIGHLAMSGIICFGPRKDRQQTFVLLDEWLPPTRTLEPDEAWSKLAQTYFSSRGPAQVKDFAWWAGLTLKDANAALDLVKNTLQCEIIGNRTFWFTDINRDKKINVSRVHLLPGFDEFILGYTDRSNVLESDHEKLVNATRNGIFGATIVRNGKAIGLWRRTLKKDKVEMHVRPFTSFSSGVQKGINSACRRYGKFLGCEVILPFDEKIS